MMWPRISTATDNRRLATSIQGLVVIITIQGVIIIPVVITRRTAQRQRLRIGSSGEADSATTADRSPQVTDSSPVTNTATTDTTAPSPAISTAAPSDSSPVTSTIATTSDTTAPSSDSSTTAPTDSSQTITDSTGGVIDHPPGTPVGLDKNAGWHCPVELRRF